MAAFEVKLPDIGEGVNEGEIVRWLVKEGDVVKHDQPLVEVMTDKATVEIPCSAEGKVVKILAKEGQVVKIGGALLSMDSAGAGATPGAETAAPTAAPATKSAPAAATAPAPTANPAPAAATQAPAAAAVAAKPQAAQSAPPVNAIPSGTATAGADVYNISPPPAGANVLATPATRRYARESGVDLNQLKGTGPSGRITREDVAKLGQGLGATAAAAPKLQPQSTSQSQSTLQSQSTYQAPAYKPTPVASQSGDERKPFRGIRKKIAENLVRSKQIIPHFTHGDEADVTELVAWRTQMKGIAEEKGVKLTYLPFIMKALVATCREFPNFNASIDDAAGEIVIKHSFNVGFAADTPEGLLVPVVKNVESKSILEIAHDIITLAEKARAGKLAPDDMRHGSITITNIGSIGGLYATPIINHPEVAIIGVYSIVKKPVVIKDEIKIRDMMNVSATCDHRLIDGAQAARFLKKFIARLEHPQALLLEMI